MSDMDGGEGWMDGVVQVALPGVMQPQPQVLMAYKSLRLIFYSAEERDCQVNTHVPGGCRNTELCVYIYIYIFVLVCVRVYVYFRSRVD